MASGALGILLLAVATGAAEPLDRSATDWLRPDNEWGPAQARLGPVIDALQPRRAYLLLGVVTAFVCLRRRDWRPAALAGYVAATSVVATVAIKVLTHRPDPNGAISSPGGSFPSGHVVSLIVCLGCCVLVAVRRTRVWQWVLVAVPPAVMATALAYAAAHWVTDLLGGALLGVATISWAASLPFRPGRPEKLHSVTEGANTESASPP